MEEILKRKFNDMEQKCREISESAHDIHKLIEGLSKTGTFFGMTGENIADLHCEYELRNGKMPMTSESIQEAFRPDKIEISEQSMKRFWGQPAFARWFQAGVLKTKTDESTIGDMPSKVFTGKVQVALYRGLPLDDVSTDYIGELLCQGDTVRITISPTMSSAAYISPCIDLTADNRIILSIKEGITVKEAALEIAIKIMDKHRYRWKAFAAQIFYRPEGYLDVIYGIVEVNHER